MNKQWICSWIQDKLDDYPDHLSLVTRRLAAHHLSECYDCRRIFQGNTLLKQALRQPLPPPPSLRSNLMQQFRQFCRIHPRCQRPRRKSPRIRIHRAAAIILIALSAVLTAWFGYRSLSHHHQSTVSQPLICVGEYVISVAVDNAYPEAAVVRLEKNVPSSYFHEVNECDQEPNWQIITIHCHPNGHDEGKFVQCF